MQHQRLSQQFLSFVEYVKQNLVGEIKQLSILDLRLECRHQRMMEYGDWSQSDLDMIEQEAARYSDKADIAHVLSGTAPRAVEVTAGWLNSPSPFAWT